MPAHTRRTRTSHAMPYYSDFPNSSTYYGSNPGGVSYSSSYLNPGGNYSSHSSLGGYARAPLAPRWVPTGRTYSPLLSTISERGANLHTLTRINSPRRYPLTSSAFTSHTHLPLISRPININTADIDVSRERYRAKSSRPDDYVVSSPPISRPRSTKTSLMSLTQLMPAPHSVDAYPFMPRIDVGVAPVENEGAFGIQRSTIQRGRTVVRLHTVKRKDRESPRKPEEAEKASEVTLFETKPIIYVAPPVSNETVIIEREDSPPGFKWRHQLSDDLTYKDKREKKSPGAKLVEKFFIKEKKYDETTLVQKGSPTYLNIEDGFEINTVKSQSDIKSPDRRCSQEHLAEQSTLFDNLILEENLSVTALDLTKVGLPDTCMIETMSRLKFGKKVQSDDIDSNYSLRTIRSDHAIHERMNSLGKNIKQRSSRKSNVKKSASGSSICRLDSMLELSKDPLVLQLPLIEETSVPINNQKIKTGPQIRTTIQSSVAVSNNIVSLKARVGSIHIVEKLSEKVPKRAIDFSVTIDNEHQFPNHSFETNLIITKDAEEVLECQIEHNGEKKRRLCSMKAQSNKPWDTNAESKIEDQCNFWDTIGKRETIYYNKRRQKIQEELKEQRKPVFWNAQKEESIEELAGLHQKNIFEAENNKSDTPENVNKTSAKVQTINSESTNDKDKPVEDTGQKKAEIYFSIEKNINTNLFSYDSQYIENETVFIKNDNETYMKTLDSCSTKLKEIESPIKIEGIITNKNIKPVLVGPQFAGCINEKKEIDIELQKEKSIPIKKDITIDEKVGFDIKQVKDDITSLMPSNSKNRSTEDIKTHDILKTNLKQYQDSTLSTLFNECELTVPSIRYLKDKTISEKIVQNITEEENKLSSRNDNKLPDSPVLKRPVKQEAAIRPLIATPRPLQKKKTQVINMSSSSESSSESESNDEEESDKSEESDESGEFYECDVVAPDGRTSTGSNDSGFDSSAPTSPSGIVFIKKGGEAALTSNTTNAASSQSSQASLYTGLETSTAYALFRRTGHITPPARTIPRFRKYAMEDFQFLKVLGKGSFGKVLLAELKDTEYYYAVKCLKKDVVLEDDDVECTLIERKVLALGTNHPYLCHLFATFQNESHLFFVMEYLNGGDLMFHIQQSGRFPEARARFYAAEIVSGLKFLHKKGIVYRDLKLDNILLDFDGHVRIADFGMCKLQIYLDRTADTFCGTPDYMAPEIIKGLKYSQTVDWWSFGVLLYEMLIGQSPFSGCDEDELFWSICNEIPSYPRFISPEALSILTRLLDKEACTRIGGPECVHGDVRDQEFFRPVHWERLEMRALEPPFRPRVRHPLDTQYFDHAFTGERPRLTSVEPHVLRIMDQQPFRGFSYTNPNATDC